MPEVTAFTVSELVWVNLQEGRGGNNPALPRLGLNQEDV